MTRPSAPRQQGVTLVELVVSIVIVAVATVGLMMAVSATAGRSADPMVESQAGAIAQAYLDEVLQTGFCDPEFDPDGNPGTGCREECSVSACSGGCAGRSFSIEGTRARFDDVCDYDGLRDSGARDRSGAALADLADYQVSIDVRDLGIGLGDPALSSDAGEVLRVEVTVAHPALGVTYRVSGYRSNAQ
ncbi:MAG: prepilin-type N-terminal cleavage/methylation domain-containing protein [Gammaproteobacteria bacterium]